MRFINREGIMNNSFLLNEFVNRFNKEVKEEYNVDRLET